MIYSAPVDMELPIITTLLRIIVLVAALASPLGCERVLQLGLTPPADTGDHDTGTSDDAGPDASDTDSSSDTDEPDGSPDGSSNDGGAT
jgi:hypothetical protein